MKECGFESYGSYRGMKFFYLNLEIGEFEWSCAETKKIATCEMAASGGDRQRQAW